MKMSKDMVLASLDRDEAYCRTHKINEPDWELPSGISKLGYISFGDPISQHYRQLVHVHTGKFIPREHIYFDDRDLTWNVKEELTPQ